MVAVLYDGNSGVENQEVIVYDPPPAIRAPLTIEDCVVDVSALYLDQMHYGKGVIVEHNGETFILTSNMIFVEPFESITVEFGPNWIVRGSIVHSNEVWGLTAVACESPLRRGWPISEAPNIPPDTESTAVTNTQSAPVKVLEYINDDWFLITGVDDTYVGAPLVNGEDITGIIIGMNCINESQAVVAGNHIIKAFCEQATRPEVK
jgi:hypothetical protein